MGMLPTVAVLIAASLVIVNVDDFDPETMTPADDAAAATLAAAGKVVKKTEKEAPVNLKALTKAELVAHAQKVGVTVDEAWTKDAILAALEAAAVK